MKLIQCLIILFISAQTFSQSEIRFKVYAGDSDQLDCPVGLSLDGISYNEDRGTIQLFEITKQKKIRIPCQLESGHSGKLWFILSGSTPKGSIREFVLKQQESDPVPASLNLKKRQGQLRIQHMQNPILDYQFKTVYPPEGVNLLYKRSGFIHPLWSPEGQVLSRIQPPDHYHHYGIWGPWTKTHIRGREVDFWNLAKGQGTVEFAGFLSEVEGPVFSGFKTLQKHIDFGASGADQVAMNEVLDVRAWSLGNGEFWLIDYTTTLNSPLDSGIMLDAYRYGGGIGFRGTERWHKENSTVLTSEKKDRLSADGTGAKWCIVEGETDSEAGRSGILFMGHTTNREFPEPMRVWPVDANGGRGDVYFEFCPIRHKDWMIQKGKDYTLKYRLLVFDGSISPEEAEVYWQGFAAPPRIEIVRSGR